MGLVRALGCMCTIGYCCEGSFPENFEIKAVIHCFWLVVWVLLDEGPVMFRRWLTTTEGSFLENLGIKAVIHFLLVELVVGVRNWAFVILEVIAAWNPGGNAVANRWWMKRLFSVSMQ